MGSTCSIAGLGAVIGRLLRDPQPPARPNASPVALPAEPPAAYPADAPHRLYCRWTIGPWGLRANLGPFPGKAATIKAAQRIRRLYLDADAFKVVLDDGKVVPITVEIALEPHGPVTQDKRPVLPFTPAQFYTAVGPDAISADRFVYHVAGPNGELVRLHDCA